MPVFQSGVEVGQDLEQIVRDVAIKARHRLISTIRDAVRIHQQRVDTRIDPDIGDLPAHHGDRECCLKVHRFVQDALTKARRDAPGAPVRNVAGTTTDGAFFDRDRRCRIEASGPDWR